MSVIDKPLIYDEIRKYLNKNQLIHLGNIISRYSLNITRQDYQVFSRIYNSIIEGKISISLVDQYVDSIIPYVDELGIMTQTEHSEELLTSGLYCYLGIYFFGLCLAGSSILELMKDMFNFVLLYLYVDHYLDDNKVDKLSKAKTVKIMMQQLYHPDLETAPPKMRGLVTAYLRLLEKAPSAKQVLIDLFLAEIEGVRYQQDSSKSRDEYLAIAEKKGGKVGDAIAACLGFPPDRAYYKIGACVQLLDDMIDAKYDRDNGIHTVATYDLDRYGTLDHLYYYTARQIEAIDPKFFIFRGLFTVNLIYALSQDGLFTRQLRRRFLTFGQLRYDQGHEMMKIVNNYLRNKIDLKISKV